MVGYINNTLSIARISDKNIQNDFSPDQMITSSGLNVSQCRFAHRLDLFNGQYFCIKVIILAELQFLRVTVMPQFNFIVPSMLNVLNIDGAKRRY